MGLLGKSRRAPRLSSPATIAELGELNFWMFERFEERTPKSAYAIWMSRLDLGWDFEAPSGLAQNAVFWLDAYPALSALSLGKDGVPNAPQGNIFAGRAMDNVDRGNEGQVNALRRITAGFFDM